MDAHQGYFPPLMNAAHGQHLLPPPLMVRPIDPAARSTGGRSKIPGQDPPRSPCVFLAKQANEVLQAVRLSNRRLPSEHGDPERADHLVGGYPSSPPMKVIFVPSSTGKAGNRPQCVLFPAPLAPMMQTISPSSIWKLKP